MNKAGRFIVKFNELDNCCRKLCAHFGRSTNAIKQFAERLTPDEREQLDEIQHLYNMICHVNDKLDPSDVVMQKLEKLVELAKSQIV